MEKAKKVSYDTRAQFISDFSVKKDFSSLASNSTGKRKKKVKSKSLLFCLEIECTEVFEDEDTFENHMLKDIHTVAKETSAMDVVKSTFVRMMKVTSADHQIHPSSKVCSLNTTLSVECETIPLMSMIKEQGWALPKRSNFRYNYFQKKILYDIFIDGEKTGKKKSPEEVKKLVRANFATAHYVADQIIVFKITKTLPRWSITRAGET